MGVSRCATVLALPEPRIRVEDQSAKMSRHYRRWGQTAFFFLFNLPRREIRRRGGIAKILLPLVPEYIGYANQGLAPDMFRAVEPKIEFLPGHRFKYHIDFDRLEIAPDVAALCVSRPTNPSGNVPDR